MPEPLLKVRKLKKHFGGLRALDGVDCDVPAGMIKAVIGPNGAGKTTFFNCLTGVSQATDGSVEFEGRKITKLSPHRIAGRGVARTWQTIRLFNHMTVLENVMVGRHSRSHCGMLTSIFRAPWQMAEERRIREFALDRLEFMGIADLARKSVDRLPFLQQRRVELARVLAAEPRLLLLDEPAAGLNTRETSELGEMIQTIRQAGVTIVLVEHDMSLVMEISDSVLVLDFGLRIAEGPPREVQENEQVIAIYLGKETDSDSDDVTD